MFKSSSLSIVGVVALAILLSLALSLATLGSAEAKRKNHHRPPKKHRRFVPPAPAYTAFGDSITMGNVPLKRARKGHRHPHHKGGRATLGYPNYLDVLDSNALRSVMPLYNLSMGGSKSGDVLIQMQSHSDYIAGSRLVTVGVGYNDLGWQQFYYDHNLCEEMITKSASGLQSPLLSLIGIRSFLRLLLTVKAVLQWL